jgi:hypothetical protein
MARKLMQIPVAPPRPKAPPPAKEKMRVTLPGQPPQSVEVKPMEPSPAPPAPRRVSVDAPPASAPPAPPPFPDDEVDRARQERVELLRKKLADRKLAEASAPKKPAARPGRQALLAHKITAAIKSRSADKTPN